MAIHSRILAWRIPWTEEPDGLQTMGSQESDGTEVTWHGLHISFYYLSIHHLSIHSSIHPFTYPSISHYFSFSGASWLTRCLSP